MSPTGEWVPETKGAPSHFPADTAKNPRITVCNGVETVAKNWLKTQKQITTTATLTEKNFK
jgi:hypothetical protein